MSPSNCKIGKMQSLRFFGFTGLPSYSINAILILSVFVGTTITTKELGNDDSTTPPLVFPDAIAREYNNETLMGAATANSSDVSMESSTQASTMSATLDSSHSTTEAVHDPSSDSNTTEGTTSSASSTTSTLPTTTESATTMDVTTTITNSITTLVPPTTTQQIDTGENVTATASVSSEDSGSMPTGIVALVTMITFASIAILAYVSLIVWRRYLEYRHGNRELLVNELEFDTNDLRHFEL